MNTDAEADAPPATSSKPVDPRLLRYAAASRVFFVALAGIALAQTVTILLFAGLLTQAITGAIEGVPRSALAPVLGSLAVVIAIRALLMWAKDAVAARAAARVQVQLRAGVFAAIAHLGEGWLHERNSAHLAVTAGRGLDSLEAYFGRYLPQLVQTVVATPLILVTIWWFDPPSGITVLVTLPLIPVFMVLIGLATRSVQRTQWQTLQRLAARFSDTVQGLSTLKVFGRQHRAAASIESVTDDYRRQTMKVLRFSFLSGFALEIIASLSVAVVAVSIGLRLLDGQLGLGVGLFVLLLAPEAFLPLRQVGAQFHAAAEGVAATDEVFDMLDAARRSPAMTPPPPSERLHADDPAVDTVAVRVPGTASAPETAPMPTVSGTSEVPASGTLTVTALRVKRGEAMLAPVDFTARPGTVTLLEGPSGVGKSSMFAALRGAVEYDGWLTLTSPTHDAGSPADAPHAIDVHTLTPSQWLAWAGQQPGLLSGTVAENVALGDEKPDDELIARALALACAEEISPSLSLGTQGAGLSGGQAQRVGVARAFYRRLRGVATVVALDEPSAALDPDTEARLWEGVRTIADEGAVVLVISHRRSARRLADQRVRMRAPRPPRHPKPEATTAPDIAAAPITEVSP